MEETLSSSGERVTMCACKRERARARYTEGREGEREATLSSSGERVTFMFSLGRDWRCVCE